jgi:hypothetical protein
MNNRLPTLAKARADHAALEAERAEIAREIQRLEESREEQAERMMRGSPGKAQQRATEAFERLTEQLAVAKRQDDALVFQQRVSAKRLEAAKKTQPKRKQVEKQLEAELAEYGQVVVGIMDDLKSIERRIARVSEGRLKVQALRTELGLPPAEPWYPLEQRALEVIASNIWWWLSENGVLPAMLKAPAPKRTLAEWFSDANLAQYLPQSDDDIDEPAKPAA